MGQSALPGGLICGSPGWQGLSVIASSRADLPGILLKCKLGCGCTKRYPGEASDWAGPVWAVMKVCLFRENGNAV